MAYKKNQSRNKLKTLENVAIGKTKLNRYVDNLITGMSKKDAAINAGYSPKTAHNPKINLDKRVMGPLAIAMEKAGIDDNVIAERLRNAMFKQTEKAITKHAIVKKKNPKTGKYETVQNGTFTEIKIIDDMKSQLSAIKIATQIRGDVVQKIEHSGGMKIENPAEKLSTEQLKAMMAIYEEKSK